MGAGPASAAPHFRQNFALVEALAPHDGQTTSILAPQASQNCASARFAAWHFGQRMDVFT
jgi:hypothetical protein